MNNLEMMRKRLEFQGGVRQEDRMIKDKYKTLQKALQYSYQGCDVQLIQSFAECIEKENEPIYRALINPDKLKQDYDDKILSINYSTNFTLGDVFTWKGTDTKWIIYLQSLTEDSYFRGNIRLCKYKIKFKDSEGNVQSTWAAIRGPVETQIDGIQKNQIRIDRPNFSLNILMPLNNKTLQAFDRYSQFIFAGKSWQVKATDSISMKNIIEVNAEEYYIDKETDDVINEIKNGLIIEPVNPTPQSKIQGETFIKPKIAEIYTAPDGGGIWSILEDYPVCIKQINDTQIQLIWQKSTSGQFTLKWSKGDTTETKVIVVESLF